MKRIKAKIKNLIKNSNREWGIYAENLNTHNKYQLNSSERFETASVIKIFILLALFNKVSQGKLSLNTLINFKKKYFDTESGSGLIKYFDISKPLVLYNIALLMIIVSDNAATNFLIDLLDVDFINEYIKKIGLEKTKLLTKKIYFSKDYSLKKTKIGTTTPYETALVLKRLVKNELFTKKLTNQIITILKRQQYSFIDRYLPTSTNLGYKRSKITKIISKTGSIVYENDNFQSVVNDTGVAYTKDNQKILLSIFSKGASDLKHLYSFDSSVKKLFGEISKNLFSYLI